MLACAIAATVLVPRPLAAADELSVQQAVEKVRKESDAKVLSVQTVQVGKRKLYRIKLLTRDGQVKVVDIKANP